MMMLVLILLHAENELASLPLLLSMMQFVDLVGEEAGSRQWLTGGSTLSSRRDDDVLYMAVWLAGPCWRTELRLVFGRFAALHWVYTTTPISADIIGCKVIGWYWIRVFKKNHRLVIINLFQHFCFNREMCSNCSN